MSKNPYNDPVTDLIGGGIVIIAFIGVMYALFGG